MKYCVAMGLALFGAMLPQGAQAKPMIYVCDIALGGPTTWLPEKVIVSHEAGETTAFVADPIIYYFNKEQPIEARVGTDNAKRLSVAWDVKVKDKAGDQAKMNFSMTIRKAEMRASITSRVDAFDYAESAGGTCKVK